MRRAAVVLGLMILLAVAFQQASAERVSPGQPVTVVESYHPADVMDPTRGTSP